MKYSKTVLQSYFGNHPANVAPDAIIIKATETYTANELIKYFTHATLPDIEITLDAYDKKINAPTLAKWLLVDIERTKGTPDYFAYVEKLNELKELLSTVNHN